MKKSKTGEGRAQILKSACAEIVENGVSASSLSIILKRSGLSKGAFYHHFPSKELLLKSIVNEYLAVWIEKTWIVNLNKSRNILITLDKILKTNKSMNSSISFEKLILVLTSEFNALDTETRHDFSKIIRKWQASIYKAVRRNIIKNNKIKYLNEKTLAWLIISSIQGNAVLMRAGGSEVTYRKSLKALRSLCTNTLSATCCS